MPLMPLVPGAFLLVATQSQSEHPRYSPFNASYTPTWAIARLSISVSRRFDYIIDRKHELPINNIVTPMTPQVPWRYISLVCFAWLRACSANCAFMLYSSVLISPLRPSTSASILLILVAGTLVNSLVFRRVDKRKVRIWEGWKRRVQEVTIEILGA